MLLLLRFFYVFTFFFKIQKGDFLRFFALLHTFSRTMIWSNVLWVHCQLSFPCHFGFCCGRCLVLFFSLHCGLSQRISERTTTDHQWTIRNMMHYFVGYLFFALSGIHCQSVAVESNISFYSVYDLRHFCREALS